MAKRPRDAAARIVDAALKIVVEQGWRAVGLEAVAEAARMAPDDVYRLTPTRPDILDLFARRIDLAVATGDDAPPPGELLEESARDRLFDVLMRRFEALTEYRAAIAVLARDLPRDPPTVAALLPQARRSFAMMLREAGLSDSGLSGRLRTTALIGVWLAVQQVWLRDDGEDMARTMAALDRHLGRLFACGPLFGENRRPSSR